MKRMAGMILVATATLIWQSYSVAQSRPALISHQTERYGVKMAADKPAFISLWLDSMGRGRSWPNGILDMEMEATYQATVEEEWICYRNEQRNTSTSFKLDESSILIKSVALGTQNAEPVALRFRFRGKYPAHATLLGVMDGNESVRMPAVLHIPGQGTLRIVGDSAAKTPLSLGYRATAEHVTLTFPAGTKDNPWVQSRLEVISVYPKCPSTEGDDRFEGYRRCWLNILQLSSKYQTLSNHAGSEVAGLCYHEYGEIAMLTGELAEGVSGPQLLRDSLEQILAGKKTYGMPGYPFGEYPENSLDTWPSLLAAAHCYYLASRDDDWAKAHIDTLLEWGRASLETDSNGNGLIEYHQSGNAGDCTVRPANWWDCINFGHEDAYSNALAYRGFRGLARLAAVAGREADAEVFEEAARKLKSAYYPTFYNGESGMLAGWKSRDGKLHDYAFTFIQGMAIAYGLVDDGDQANRLIDAMLKKLEAVGFDRFDLGLPGNLINVPEEDYYRNTKPRWGGEGAYQVYENGGASANHVYFTLAALYKLGRREEADRILLPILNSFNECGFQGSPGTNGEKTNDWRTWDGVPWGYEGLLSDNYLVVKAVLVREGMVDPLWGYWLE